MFYLLKIYTTFLPGRYSMCQHFCKILMMLQFLDGRWWQWRGTHLWLKLWFCVPQHSECILPGHRSYSGRHRDFVYLAVCDLCWHLFPGDLLFRK